MAQQIFGGQDRRPPSRASSSASVGAGAHHRRSVLLGRRQGEARGRPDGMFWRSRCWPNLRLLGGFADLSADRYRYSPRVASRSDGIASLPSRALGAFVDTVILAPVVVPVSLLVHPTWLAFSIVTAIGCAYQVPQIAIWGLTPGCRSAEIKVTSHDGRPPRWTRAFLRWATPGVISNGYRLIAPGRVGLLVGIMVICILYAPALFDPSRRAIIDRVAGTIVLERAASAPRP